MNAPNKQNPIPKVIALILVSVGAAWLMMKSDASTMVKLDSISPADYIQHQRELHNHSFVYHFILLLMMGGFYVGIIEFITYLISLVLPNKPDA